MSTGDSRINWIVGLFYNVNEYNALSSEFTPGYGEFVGPSFRQDLDDLEYFEADRSELEETAIYGEIGFDITDQWTVTFGARRSSQMLTYPAAALMTVFGKRLGLM